MVFFLLQSYFLYVVLNQNGSLFFGCLYYKHLATVYLTFEP